MDLSNASFSIVVSLQMEQKLDSYVRCRRLPPLERVTGVAEGRVHHTRVYIEPHSHHNQNDMSRQEVKSVTSGIY